MPKLLLPALIVAIAGFALWSSGVFEPADPGAGTESNGSELDPGPSLEAGAAKKAPSDEGGQLSVEAGAQSTDSKVATPAPKKGDPIGRTGPAPKGAAIFPDGTWLPPLNGVEIAPPFPGFAPDYPYAPVVEIVLGDKGISWYIHADGSHSTTQLVETTQGGRTFTQAGWAVGNPTKTLPIDVAGSGAPNSKGSAKPPSKNPPNDAK